MAQYIDKDALVVMIKSRMATNKHENPLTASAYVEDEDILEAIDTLEVKEVAWHDASETPKGAGDKEILVQFADSHAGVLEIDDWEYLDHQTKWAYLKDLT